MDPVESVDLVRMRYLVPGVLVYGHPHRSTDLDWKDNSSEDALRGERVDMAAGNRHHDVAADLRHSPVDSCGWDREGSVARILHCGQTSC